MTLPKPDPRIADPCGDHPCVACGERTVLYFAERLGYLWVVCDGCGVKL